MSKIDRQVFELKVMWGALEMKPDGCVEWHPNDRLKKTAQEQLDENMRGGLFEGMTLVGRYR